MQIDPQVESNKINKNECGLKNKTKKVMSSQMIKPAHQLKCTLLDSWTRTGKLKI